MPDPESNAFSMEISAAEKDDLEKMIGTFRRQRQQAPAPGPNASFQDQLDHIHKKLADVADMISNIDRRMESLAKVIRLSQQKTELLNRRLDAVIEALKEKDARPENEHQ